MAGTGRKKGTPKTGGRKKGSLNKATVLSQQLGVDLKKDAIVPILRTYILNADIPDYLKDSLMLKHLLESEAKDALAFVERLMQYVLPKMQSSAVDVTLESRKTIEDTLIELSDINEEG